MIEKSYGRKIKVSDDKHSTGILSPACDGNITPLILIYSLITKLP